MVELESNGAPISSREGALARAFSPGGRLAALIVVLALTVLFPVTTASARFTRPFLRQITATPSARFTETLDGPGGLAVDAEDNLWVGDEETNEPPFQLDEFASVEHGNTFLRTLNIAGLNPPAEGLTPPSSMAINQASNALYVTGDSTTRLFPPYVEEFDNTGAYLTRWEVLAGGAHVAIDNSAEPSQGSVYAAASGGQYVGKFNADGEPVNFTATAPYVSANRITGTPSESFGYGAPSGIAVDSHGHIYATNAQHGEIDEYTSSGLFIRAFRGAETPGLGQHRDGPFGGVPRDVSIDPTNGDVLVSVSSVSSEGPVQGAIDEFDAVGHFIAQITETLLGQPLHSAFELTLDRNGDLYVASKDGDVEQAVDVYGPGHFLPSLKVLEPAQREPTHTLVAGEVDPEGRPLTDCHFEYLTAASFNANLQTTPGNGFSDLSSGGSTPCQPTAASIPVDSAYHPVTAELTGLTSGSTYRYRLVATSSGELAGTAASSPLAFTAPHEPRVEGTAATNVSSTFSDLRASVNPLGADTAYHFEYLTSAEFDENREAGTDGFSGPHPATSVPAPAADVGTGGETGAESQTVLQQIGGLRPSTSYRFRVVAANQIGSIAGEHGEGGQEIPDTFATLPAAASGLPDGRAYELVTPPNKGGAQDMFLEAESEFHTFKNADRAYPSESGEQLLLETKAAFGPFPASSNNAYVFSRTSRRWTTTSLASPSMGIQSLFAATFAPFEFSRVAIDDFVGSGGSGGGTQRTSLVGPPGGPYTTIHADPGVHLGETENAGGETRVVGGSRDLGQLVIESRDHTLAAGAAGQDTASHALYEWDEGELRLLNVQSNGALLSRCGAVLGEHLFGGAHDAVSADGSRVFFTAPDPYAKNAGPGCWDGASANTPQLYLRSGGATVQVSAPSPEAPEVSPHPALFVGAAEDGSKVFFLSEGELTKDAQGVHDDELYEYDTETKAITRISAGESGHASGDVRTVPAVSADGSAVYFTAGARLTSASPATVPAEDVYLYRYDTKSATTTYVATIWEYDYPTGQIGGWYSTNVRTQHALASVANWYTTPDGRYLLFASAAEPTPNVTSEAAPSDCPGLANQSHTNGHCAEIYRYDAGTGALLCLSCTPNGVLPTTNAFFGESTGRTAFAAGPVEALSENGDYAFFDTGDALVPTDTNGTLDVYEWHDGAISLVSSGHDPAPSYFLAQSAVSNAGGKVEAANVFFGTHAQLVTEDGDTAGDVYDARICTYAEPCVSAAAGETAQCEGGACQNPPLLPIEATPGTFTLSGAGNLVDTFSVVKPARSNGAQTNAMRLSRALRACRKRPKRQRRACRRRALKRFGGSKLKGKR